MSKSSQLSSMVMVIAVAVIAYAADDTVHELIGHGGANCLLGAKVISISTVAVQTTGSSKWTSAAGSLANAIAGVIAFVLFRRMKGFGALRYLVWLFGFVNLMNGTGYLVASALLNYGDWSAVIAGWIPPWAWRTGMGLVGAALFVVSVRWAAGLMRDRVSSGAVAAQDVFRLCVPAYIAGGLLFVAASALNRITPGQILSSGVGASFGLTFGLLRVPALAASDAPEDGPEPSPLALHWGWVALAIVVGGIFIAVFGPGVRLA